jgi:alpha-tubulin suppressor-like RCC1 family protein
MEDYGGDGQWSNSIREMGFYPSIYGSNGSRVDTNKVAVITQIATGEMQSIALSMAGDIYIWGAFRDDKGRTFRNMPPPDDKRVRTGNKEMTKLEEDENQDWYHPPRSTQDCSGKAVKSIFSL